jgi:phospholipid/cholesterol/gamma-HCH transport system ATP-binding protein
MTSAAIPKIELSGLTKAFGDNHALQGAALRVEAGASTVLIGPSGSGKTVLMKCVLGLMQPDGGQVLVDGVDTAGLKGGDRTEFIRRFGMLFQRGGLFDSLPVWENVAFRLLQEHNISRPKARDTAIEKLASVGSVGLDAAVGDLFPVEISGGMQKRVGLARAIATDPEILLLDEPTAGLDPIMTNVISRLINDAVKNLGATALCITSDMAGARAVAQSIAMIHEGRIVWQGPTASADDSGNPYVDQFIHSRADGPIRMRLAADAR